ncbi:MAG: BREX-1 system adenine-specific DNA-methyltransferase PglX [Limisphaerales bacterium]
MAFDSATRNRLASFVSEARRLIAVEFTQKFESLYGISEAGQVTPVAQLGHLADAGLATATRLRERIDYLVRTQPEDRGGTQAAVVRLAREQAFTVLNRLAAVRMAEKRGIIVESVGRGYQSRGFQVFEKVAGSGLGDSYHRYRRYLFCLFDELAVDLGVLFERRSPFGLLFPRERALLELLDLLNAPELDALWSEDETIGWIYQYWNDPAERKKMREQSAAPRNSRELAVRNQFFTPRYVVEFLTDNTLGRIWYEMTQGETGLKEQCRYLVRRPTEIFLKPGEVAPAERAEGGGRKAEGAASQEELLRQPVHIPHRPLKDPRTILMLDPACGSMHFGLYAFDLFEVIYDEAWALEERLGADALSRPPGMKSLHATYAGKDSFLKDVPRLIIEHNLHGIDIDPRCAQIAGLSLWLRAQKAWQRLGLKPAERPAIKRSNIVCAEPMPGEKELLREFVEREFPAAERGVFLQLLTAVWEQMELAGEAGSLLKIEEEIRSAIEDAREAWQKLATKPQELFTTAELNRISSAPQLTGLEVAAASLITDHRPLATDFWERIEERIYVALRDYAEQAEDGGGFQRRLFAEDAARGFAFIDVCRKRYDVVEMNPPFGEFSKQWKEQAQRDYPNSYNDILSAFVDSFAQRLASDGLLGAVTSRTCFFLLSFEKWRKGVVLAMTKPVVLADLGQGVMDAAMVEAAAYVLQKSDFVPPLICSRLLAEDDKAAKLANAIEAARSGVPSKNCFVVAPTEFLDVPGSPFCYWVASHVRQLFVTFSPFDSDGREAKQGLATGEDFRFVRAWWEVPPEEFVSLPQGSTQEDYRASTKGRISWCPFAKGGAFSPFYQDLNLVVRWSDDGYEVRNFSDPKTGYIFSRYRGAERYFLPGFTYADRAATRFAPRILPEGAVISVKGSGIYCGVDENAWAALAVLNSAIFSRMMDLLLGRVDLAKSYQVNTVGRVPWPKLSEQSSRRLSSYAQEGWKQRFQCDQCDGTSHAFVLPAIFRVSGNSIEQRHAHWMKLVLERDGVLSNIQTTTDAITLDAFGLSDSDSSAIEEASTSIEHIASVNEEDDSDATSDADSLTASFVDYAIGLTFGRWDIRYATGERIAPELPDPFAPLPVCPPGQLQNAQGRPVERAESGKLKAEKYPIEIPWDGILVDDPNHPLDLERRVREVIEIIWGRTIPTGLRPGAQGCEGRATLGAPAETGPTPTGLRQASDVAWRNPVGVDGSSGMVSQGSSALASLGCQPESPRDSSATPEAIEHEACEILGVKSLRDYFRRPAGFFADHLKRYSKSRRQAPIYWPLSTASGSYTLWIFYHRLNDQTLHTALADFLDPKLKAVRTEIASLRESGKHGSRLAELTEFESELADLRAEIERVIKLPWKPNLNDGVLITASPLWKLFRLPKWQKDLKACWAELEKGDYDWAHLAYTIWPDRVREKCKTDRSLAIAHGLEELCTVAPPKPKKTRTTKPQAAEDSEHDAEPELPMIPAATTQRRAKAAAAPAAASSPSRPAREAASADDEEESEARPVPIDQVDRTEVLCTIRQVFNDGQARDRDTAMREVAAALGYQRVGSRIREALHVDLLTAVRRGILQNEGGELSIVARDIRDYTRDSLKDDFLTAIGRAWIEREEALRTFARWMGYARTGPVIDEMGRSLINGLIREDRLEAQGNEIRRRS